MVKTEKLKLVLKLKYEQEFEVWKREEEARQLERQREEQRRQEELERRRQEDIAKYHDEKEKSIAMQRDYEAALFHQLQVII